MKFPSSDVFCNHSVTEKAAFLLPAPIVTTFSATFLICLVRMKVTKKPVTNGYRLQNGYKERTGKRDKIRSVRNGKLKRIHDLRLLQPVVMST